MKYKYMRIQGREIAEYTNYANGVFGIFRDFEKKNVLNKEDYELFKAIDDHFAQELPWPQICNERQKVICFFKTENSEKMEKYMQPLLFLLDRYNHPYDVIYTNYPGNIVYEDDFQVAVTIDGLQYDKVDYMDKDIYDKQARK